MLFPPLGYIFPPCIQSPEKSLSVSNPNYDCDNNAQRPLAGQLAVETCGFYLFLCVPVLLTRKAIEVSYQMAENLYIILKALMPITYW